MPNIVSELSKVRYLHRIIIGLDAANEAQYRHAKQFFKGLNQNHIVFWNDSPRMTALGQRLQDLGSGTRRKRQRQECMLPSRLSDRLCR